MKIALCISCHLRTYKETAPNLFKNVIDPLTASGHTVDIFVNTYSTISNMNRSWWMTDAIWKEYEPIASSTVYHNSIKSVYHPVAIKINKQEIPEGTGHMDLWHVLQAYTSSYNAVKMAQEHSSYDRVVLTRGDINFVSKVNVDTLINATGLLVSNHGYFLKKGSISDIWIAGTLDAVLTSLSLCNEDNWKKYVDGKKVQHFEDLYNEYIHATGVNIKVLPVDWEICRIGTTPFKPEAYDRYHYRVNYSDIKKDPVNILKSLYDECITLVPDNLKKDVELAYKEKRAGHLRGWIHTFKC